MKYLAAFGTGVGAQFVLAWLVSFIGTPAGGEAVERLLAFPPTLLVLAGIILFAWTLFEEWVFRNKLFMWAEKKWSATRAIHITALSFGLAHVTLGGLDALALVPLGYGLALWRLRTGTAWAALACHLGFNLCGFALTVW